MTPKKAIREECGWCCNAKTFAGCSSELCKLNDTELTNMKKIKAHCINCVPEHSYNAVKNCTGYVDNPTPHQCTLHPFRLGKNPRRVELGKKLSEKVGVAMIEPFKFKSKLEKGMVDLDPSIANIISKNMDKLVG
jgi:hypothetical protein